jgi:hypothetical protein
VGGRVWGVVKVKSLTDTRHPISNTLLYYAEARVLAFSTASSMLPTM